MLLEDPRIDVDIITDFTRGSAVQIAWKRAPKKPSGDVLSDDYANTAHNGYLECVKAIYRLKNSTCDARSSIARSERLHRRSSSLEELKNIVDFSEESKVKVDNYSIDRKLLQMSKSTKATEESVSSFGCEQVEHVLSKYLPYIKIKSIPSIVIQRIMDQKSYMSKEELQANKNFMWEYQGLIERPKSMGVTTTTRWIKVNPIDGSLIEYKAKEDCPNKPYRIIPLHTITNITINHHRWIMKKNLLYWEINT